MARRVYSWIGGTQGRLQSRLRSLHDISEGGLLVAVAESMLARGLGAVLNIPAGRNPWEFMFGEGFHSFVATVSEADASSVEAEWDENHVPFKRLGTVQVQDRLEVFLEGVDPLAGPKSALNVGVKQNSLRMGKGGLLGMNAPRALVITGDGINCEQETAQAFRMAKFETEIHHLNDLIAEQMTLDRLSSTYSALALPGGFSFGDDLSSWKSPCSQNSASLEMGSFDLRQSRRISDWDL